jgi:single-strand DNA-binding protein
MVNRVILIGNLGRDPEVRHLESGSVVAKFAVATNESYKDKAGEWQTVTEWHDIVVWRQLAERAERDLKKGSLVYVEGKLTKRKWQDKEGNDRYTTEVVANTFRLLERRDANKTGSFPSADDEFPATKPATKTPSIENKEVEDDLPF